MNLNLTAMAWRNIRSRRARSWLTILGILIGVMAIITLISVGTGVENAVLRQFKDIGLDVVLLTPRAGWTHSGGAPGSDIESSASIGGDTIGSDFSSIGESIEADPDFPTQLGNGDFDPQRLRRDVPEVTEIGRIATRVLPVSTADLAGFVRVLTPSHDLMSLFPGLLGGFAVAQGRALEPDGVREILLGARAAGLLGANVGQSILVGGTSFTVVGILAPSREDRWAIGGDMVSGEGVEVFKALARTDDAVFVPYEEAMELWQDEPMSSMVAIRIRTGISVTETILKINTALVHQGVSMTPVSTQALADNVQRTLGMVKTVLASIAAISLLVGAVGMMNTMYTAVLERTREIGILKSVGAKDRQVLGLFLIDSGLMGLVGGVLGLVIGIGVSFAGTSALGRLLGVTSFSPAFLPWLLAGVVGFSFVLGALAGAWPAWHASRLDPVRALRSL